MTIKEFKILSIGKKYFYRILNDDRVCERGYIANGEGNIVRNMDFKDWIIGVDDWWNRERGM